MGDLWYRIVRRWKQRAFQKFIKEELISAPFGDRDPDIYCVICDINFKPVHNIDERGTVVGPLRDHVWLHVAGAKFMDRPKREPVEEQIWHGTA